MVGDFLWLLRREADVPLGDVWLSARERAVLVTLQAAPKRASWRLGRFASKSLLVRALGLAPGALADVEILADNSGAPEAFASANGARLPVALSLSHRAGDAFAIVGPAGAQLGCDIELVEPRSAAFVADYLTLPEQRYVQASAEDLAANLVWSAKESVLKAVRVGLSRDPRELEVTASAEQDDEGWASLVVADVASGDRWPGRWRRHGASVLTVVARVEPRLVRADVVAPFA